MGQEKIPKDILDCVLELGKDTVSTMNACESKYLNFLFQKDKNIFDFCGKEIAFFTGNTGSIRSTKKDFFNEEKYFIRQNRFFPCGSNQLIIFYEDEIKQTGYDAVIISSSKKLVTKKEIMKQLKKKKQK